MSMEKIDNLGSRIKIIREASNLSKKDFASRLEISAPYATELESGKAKSISKSLAKLIEYEFGYNMHWVLDGEGEMRKEVSSRKQPCLVAESDAPPYLSEKIQKLIEYEDHMPEETAHAVDEAIRSLQTKKQLSDLQKQVEKLKAS